MKLADLTAQYVEAYNQLLVTAGYSFSQVNKRMQVVNALIGRSARPEHGCELLTWNWDSRVMTHGNPAKHRALPTLIQRRLPSAIQKQVTVTDVARHLDSLPVSVPSRKLHLAALRQFFDGLVLRHGVILSRWRTCRI